MALWPPFSTALPNNRVTKIEPQWMWSPTRHSQGVLDREGSPLKLPLHNESPSADPEASTIQSVELCGHPHSRLSARRTQLDGGRGRLVVLAAEVGPWSNETAQFLMLR